jgi:hypothetical protein
MTAKPDAEDRLRASAVPLRGECLLPDEIADSEAYARAAVAYAFGSCVRLET